MSKIEELLGKDAKDLLEYEPVFSKNSLHIPSPDWVSRTFGPSDRSCRTLRSLQSLFSHGRLANTGYLSILPVDQGVEHSAGASFSANTSYFDPEKIVQLAIEGGCNGVASTLGVLSLVARKYAHKIPFIMKCNHNELLSFPNQYDQTIFASVQQAYDMGCVGVGATIYFGSPESRRQIVEVTEMFEVAHDLGMATILWCYIRNKAFKTGDKDFHSAADLTGQANHLGATIGADIVKQKLPTTNGGYTTLKFGKSTDAMYKGQHLIDYCRYQVVSSYMGRIGLINSGGASSGEADLKEAVKTAVVNKRAGGMGLILGRKAFQKPLQEGVEILHNVQDVYLDPNITIG